MNIVIEPIPYGAYIARTADGRSLLFQTDVSLASLASSLGWIPCNQCNFTDGTISCQHKQVIQMLEEARKWIEENTGKELSDPGYFETSAAKT